MWRTAFGRKTILLNGEDYDVFADGTVVIKSTPQHLESTGIGHAGSSMVARVRALINRVEIQRVGLTNRRIGGQQMRANLFWLNDQQWDKAKSQGRIDGLVALAMALSAAVTRPPEPTFDPCALIP